MIDLEPSFFSSFGCLGVFGFWVLDYEDIDANLAKFWQATISKLFIGLPWSLLYFNSSFFLLEVVVLSDFETSICFVFGWLLSKIWTFSFCLYW